MYASFQLEIKLAFSRVRGERNNGAKYAASSMPQEALGTLLI